MAWIGAAIAGASAIGGDLLSMKGQENTNAAMLQNQKQLEDWETQMSNTAMTRRVDDLKQAGLNPLLAVGEGGASTPAMGPVNLQNPMQSFSQLGQQAASAVGIAQTQQLNDAQIDKMHAEAAKTRASTPVPPVVDGSTTPGQMPSTLEYRKLTAEAEGAEKNVGLVEQQTRNMAYTLDNILPQEARQKTIDADTAGKLMPFTIEAAKAHAALLDAGIPEAEARQRMFESPIGKFIPYLDEAAKVVGMGTGVFAMAKLWRGGGLGSASSAAPAKDVFDAFQGVH